MKDQLGSDDYRDPNRFDYHYDRDDRLSRMPEEMRGKVTVPGSKNVFRRNRTLSVILIDLLLIGLVWFVFLPLIRTGATGTLQGYSFSLHGFSYGGKALMSLKVVKEKDISDLPPSYTAGFSLSSSEKTVEMQGRLPSALHGEATLRTSLPLSGKTRAVLCTVTIGGKTLSLKAKLQQES